MCRLFVVFLAAASFGWLLPRPALAGSAIGANFTASSIGESGFFPPDSMGTVGPNHVALLINGRYELYNKNSTGSPITGEAMSLNTFWSTKVGVSGRNGNSFDPRIVYDPYTRRWFAISVDGGDTTNSGYLVAVSNSANPLDGWKGFRFKAEPTGVRWADYPTLSIDADGLYIASNNFQVTGQTAAFQYALHAIPMTSLLAATPSDAGRISFTPTSGTNQGMTALDGLGIEDGVPLNFWRSGNSSFGRTIVSGTFAGGLSLSNGSATVTNRSSPSNARQPDGTSNLEVDSSRFSSRLVRIGGSYWGVQTRKSGSDDVIRWFQINATTFAQQQEGLIAISGLDLYYPALAVNSRGDVVIGFSASGPSAGQYIGAYAVAGSTSGGVTSFGTPMLLKAGTASYQRLSSNRNRWGDYSATDLDPADPNIFWTWQEWASGTQDWAEQATEIVTWANGEFQWKQASGSNAFATASNWFNASGTPASGDWAIFSRSNPGSTATVTFSGTTSVSRADVRQGTFAWSIPSGANFNLTNNTAGIGSLDLSPYQGTSALSISGGGTLSTVRAFIGSGIGGTATLTITGATWNNSLSVYVGGDDSGIGGIGTLQINAGATATIADTLLAYASGAVIVNGGSLSAGAVALHGNTTIQGGGTLAATGTIDGTLTLGAGGARIIADGGSLTISGPINAPSPTTLIIGAGGTFASEPVVAGPLASLTPQSVPEPASLLLLGAIGWAAARRRQGPLSSVS